MTSPILDRALALRAHGLVPIPLQGKIPKLSGWQKLTLDTVPEATIKKWHAKGLLQNVGLLCGAASGNLVVLDFDGLGGYEAFQTALPALAHTFTVATGSGKGRHAYYRVATLPKSTGQLDVPGGHIEIKSEGRQVVAPPSIHPETQQPYTVALSVPMQMLDDRQWATFQQWLDTHNPPKPSLMDEIPDFAPSAAGGPTPHQTYAGKALENESALLASAPNGNRNNQLNQSAFSLGQLVASGLLTYDDVKRALFQSCVSNGLVGEEGSERFEGTFQSGLEAGMGQPRYIPERDSRPARATMPGAPAYVPPTTKDPETGIVTVGRSRILKRSALFDDYAQRVNDDNYESPLPPIRFPLKALHFLGGQALVTKPGKVIGFVGSSGSGKTTALETLADCYVSQGVPVLMWTPEWEPDEMMERAVQRYGGPTQDALYLHEIAKHAMQHDQPYNQYDLLPVNQREAADKAMAHLMLWTTQVNYLENALLTVHEMAEVVAGARGLIEPMPRVLICDYAQLLKANEAEDDESTMYNLVQRFKRLCVYYGMIGVLATQTRKNDAERNINPGAFKGTTILNVTKNSRGHKGRVRVAHDAGLLRIGDTAYPDQSFGDKLHLLGSQAGRYINDDAFNLFITLNPEYEAEIDTLLDTNHRAAPAINQEGNQSHVAHTAPD